MTDKFSQNRELLFPDHNTFDADSSSEKSKLKEKLTIAAVASLAVGALLTPVGIVHKIAKDDYAKTQEKRHQIYQGLLDDGFTNELPTFIGLNQVELVVGDCKINTAWIQTEKDENGILDITEYTIGLSHNREVTFRNASELVDIFGENPCINPAFN
jgi:hypothetical protein